MGTKVKVRIVILIAVMLASFSSVGFVNGEEEKPFTFDGGIGSTLGNTVITQPIIKQLEQPLTQTQCKSLFESYESKYHSEKMRRVKLCEESNKVKLDGWDNLRLKVGPQSLLTHKIKCHARVDYCNAPDLTEQSKWFSSPEERCKKEREESGFFRKTLEDAQKEIRVIAGERKECCKFLPTNKEFLKCSANYENCEGDFPLDKDRSTKALCQKEMVLVRQIKVLEAIREGELPSACPILVKLPATKRDSSFKELDEALVAKINTLQEQSQFA